VDLQVKIHVVLSFYSYGQVNSVYSLYLAFPCLTDWVFGVLINSVNAQVTMRVGSQLMWNPENLYRLIDEETRRYALYLVRYLHVVVDLG
jgi:hypothetical protein